jgi:hypothetical protein
MLLMTGNTRSEDGGQGRAVLWRVHRSEAQTLDGHRSGGYARERVGMPVQSRSFALNRFATRNLRYLVKDRISLTASLHDGSPRDTKVPRQLPRRGGVS